MKLRSLLVAAMVCMMAGYTYGDVAGNSGQSGNSAIPDNNTGGTTSVVTITQNEIIQDAKFTIEGINHSWIGDLIIEVEHSTSGKTAMLMNRVGNSITQLTGDSSDVNGTYMFQDGNTSLWSAAAIPNDTEFVPVGTYDASGFGEAVVSLNSIFAGETTEGDWTFTIADANATQAGTYVQTSVQFTSTAVPEPGTMATLVFGTFLGGVYFRRRHQKKTA